MKFYPHCLVRQLSVWQKLAILEDNQAEYFRHQSCFFNSPFKSFQKLSWICVPHIPILICLGNIGIGIWYRYESLVRYLLSMLTNLICWLCWLKLKLITMMTTLVMLTEQIYSKFIRLIKVKDQQCLNTDAMLLCCTKQIQGIWKCLNTTPGPPEWLDTDSNRW